MPSYLQRSERKQRLVSEGTAITKSEMFPVFPQRVLEPEIGSKLVGAQGGVMLSLRSGISGGCWISGNDGLHFDDELGDEGGGKGGCCLVTHSRGTSMS